MRILHTSLFGTPLYRWLLLAGVFLILLGASFVIRSQFDIEWTISSVQNFVDSLGAWGPIAFIGILTFRFLFLIPTELLLLAAGLVFGPGEGTLYAGLGITGSGLLKYAFVSVVGSDVLLNQLPKTVQQWMVSISTKKMSVWALGGVCAYPFLPKHIFQFGAILSGMSLAPYIAAIMTGGFIRAAIFTNIGEAISGGASLVAASIILLVCLALPISVPPWRRWMLAPLVKPNS